MFYMRGQAFQVLSEYLQLLDSLSELSAVQEMSRGVEVNWLTALELLEYPVMNSLSHNFFYWFSLESS